MVRLIQLLCPQRHCICAFAYEPGVTVAPGPGEGMVLDEHNAAGYMKAYVDDLFARKVIDPWCGLCNSKQLVYEDRPSVFATLEAARPMLEQVQMQQAMTREYFRKTRN